MGNTVVKRAPEDATTPQHENQQANHIVMGGNRMLDDEPTESSFVFPELIPPDEVVHFPTSSKHVPAVIRWKHGGEEVYVSGSYDNWTNKLRLNRSTEDFVAIVELPEGKHEYKFLVDNEWKIDPNEPKVESGKGSLNNYLEVKPSDFEVFEALAFDSTATREVTKTDYSSCDEDDEVYSQEVPVGMLEDSSIHPPSLPPHLLNKVLLNQDIDMSYEPSLLPEPQHVMLNHMYALSIKEGVMALSATHRYKKKFVTTLLYKPI